MAHMPELHLIAEVSADQQVLRGQCSVCGAPFREVSAADLKPMIQQFEQHAMQAHAEMQNSFVPARSDAIRAVQGSAAGNG
jgi:hypothetical protein